MVAKSLESRTSFASAMRAGGLVAAFHGGFIEGAERREVGPRDHVVPAEGEACLEPGDGTDDEGEVEAGGGLSRHEQAAAK